MWLLYWLPDNLLQFLIHAILLFGVICTLLYNFLHYIPGIYQYRVALKVISYILLLSGMYFEGGYENEIYWRKQIAIVEKKVAIAEAKSQQVNVQIKEVVVEKIKVVKEKVVVNRDIIKHHREIIDSGCKLPDITFDIYNNAVNNGGNNE